MVLFICSCFQYVFDDLTCKKGKLMRPAEVNLNKWEETKSNWRYSCIVYSERTRYLYQAVIIKQNSSHQLHIPYTDIHYHTPPSTTNLSIRMIKTAIYNKNESLWELLSQSINKWRIGVIYFFLYGRNLGVIFQVLQFGSIFDNSWILTKPTGTSTLLFLHVFRANFKANAF